MVRVGSGKWLQLSEDQLGFHFCPPVLRLCHPSFNQCYMKPFRGMFNTNLPSEEFRRDRARPIGSNKKVKPPVRPNLRTVDRLPGSARGTTVRRSTGLWATRVGTRHRIGASPIRPYDCPPWDLLESMGSPLSLRMKVALLNARWCEESV